MTNSIYFVPDAHTTINKEEAYLQEDQDPQASTPERLKKLEIFPRYYIQCNIR